MQLLLPVAENLAPLQRKIDRFKESVSDRYTVTQEMIPLTLSVSEMWRIARSNGPDPVQLFGHIPCPQVYDGIDGHGYRAGSKDLLYAVDETEVLATHEDGSYELKWATAMKRVVGRVDFAGMPLFGDELVLTAASLDLYDAYVNGRVSYPEESILNCELDYMSPGLGNNLIGIMEGVTGPGSVLDTRGQFPFKQFYQFYSGRTYVCGSMFDGGEPYFIGTWNTGSAFDYASGLVKMLVMTLFCSNGWHTDDWYLQRAAMIGGSLAVTYGTRTPPTLDKWAGRVDIGEAMRQGGAMYTVAGYLTLPRIVWMGGTLSQTQYQELKGLYQSLESRVAKIDGGGEVIIVDDDPPPPPGTNLALASVGAVAIASSSYQDGLHGADKANNGRRAATDWNFGGGWASAVQDRYPEWLQVALPAPTSISRVVVFSLQDDYEHALEPTDTTPFTKYGLVDFTVECWINNAWQVVATVVGNNLAKRSVSFQTISTTKFRVAGTKSAYGFVTIVELEAYAE